MPNSMSLYEKQMKDCSRKPPVHGNLLDLWITTFRNSFRTLVSHFQPEIRFDTVEIDSFIYSSGGNWQILPPSPKETKFSPFNPNKRIFQMFLFCKPLFCPWLQPTV